MRSKKFRTNKFITKRLKNSKKKSRKKRVKRINSRKKQLGGSAEVKPTNHERLDAKLKEYETPTLTDSEFEGNRLFDLVHTSKGNTTIKKGQSGAQIHIHTAEDKSKTLIKYYLSGGGKHESFTRIWPKVIGKRKLVEAFNKYESPPQSEGLVRVYSYGPIIKRAYTSQYAWLYMVSPRRHNDFFYSYGGFYKYADMLSCLYDLYTTYNKKIKDEKNFYIYIKKYRDVFQGFGANETNDVDEAEDESGRAEGEGGEELYEGFDTQNKQIVTPCALNEVVIQRILFRYFTKNKLNRKFLVTYKDFEFYRRKLYIEQELLGHEEPSFTEHHALKTITDLYTFIDYFSDIGYILTQNPEISYDDYLKYIEDFFSYVLFNMLGITKDELTAEIFFGYAEQFFIKSKKDATILECLKTFNEGTFFGVMRDLFLNVGFLHLDFKMKNIFVRYSEPEYAFEGFGDRPPVYNHSRKRKQYENYSLVIADLDKSRLQVKKSKYDEIFSDI